MDEICKIRTNMALHFLNWNICKQLALHYVTTTKPLSNKTGGTFFWRIKMKVWTFRVRWTPISYSPLSGKLPFSWNSPSIWLKNLHRETRLVSFLESRILFFATLTYSGNNLSVKILKSLCQDILLCKS